MDPNAIISNLFSEKNIFLEATFEANERIMIDGENINIRYVDDILILTSNGKVQIVMNRSVNISMQYSVKLNIKKANHMIISAPDNGLVSILMKISRESMVCVHYNEPVIPKT